MGSVGKDEINLMLNVVRTNNVKGKNVLSQFSEGLSFESKNRMIM